MNREENQPFQQLFKQEATTMQFKTFVVTTLLPESSQVKLKLYKRELLNMFGGCTEYANAKGEWVNDNGQIESDDVTVWEVFTDKHINALWLKNFMTQLKEFTSQKAQCYAIDGQLFTV